MQERLERSPCTMDGGTESMTGQAFIEMMKQDIATSENKDLLSEVVAAMGHVVSLHPNCEIDSAKTADGCYKQIYDYASKNKKGNVCVVGHEKTIEIVAEYLGLTPVACEPKKQVGRVSLEDFL